MNTITTDENRIALVERLLNAKYIDFREALMLLHETEIVQNHWFFSQPIPQPLIPMWQPTYPFYQDSITCQ